MVTNNNISWHDHSVKKVDRRDLKKHRSCAIWFTGLSGSGKSTLANALEAKLLESNVHTYLLDGDNVRHGLNQDLGFSDADRTENIRRISEVAKLFVDSGTIVMTAFISPFQEGRDFCRSILGQNEFIEIFVRCPLEVCESRDTKGLYKKAREGIIKEFTGISSPYEEPKSPELVVDTSKLSVEESIEKIHQFLKKKEILKND